jgi:hypothetical protein
MVDIIEDLMNTISTDADPYMNLVPGTYWPPHIQTLVRARIAQYHPDDPLKIRLCDYSL